MTERSWDPEAIADEVEAARRAGGRLVPFTDRFPDFDLEAAYQVSGILACRRAATSRLVGRKIGFTNKATWEGAGLAQPVWATLFADTVFRTGVDAFPDVSMAGTVEPKIECEVVLTLRSTPAPGARGAEAARSVAEVGLGFEVADAPFPGWKMHPADAVATGGIHHALAVGPMVPAGDPERLSETLAALTIVMTCNFDHAADGAGRLVMGNPLDALGALADMAAARGAPLQPGEIVTTGTLTPPLDCAATEFYRSEAADEVLPAAGISLVA